MDLFLAETFVSQNGDSLQRARLFSLLQDRPSDDRSVVSFSNLQNTDGSFPAMRRLGLPGTVNNTLDALWWLDELGRLDSVAARSACAWLIDRQDGDGSWDERPLANVDFPPWIEPGELATITYLSAYAAFWLARCGLRHHSAFQRSLGFLQRHQKTSGCIEGTLHATWISAAVFQLAGTCYAEVVSQCLACLAGRPLAQWEDSQLGWALNCLGNAGFTLSHPFVADCLKELSRRQGNDGSWRSEDGPEFAVEATLGALRAFHLFKVRGHKE
jgi:hypothetical protein